MPSQDQGREGKDPSDVNSPKKKTGGKKTGVGRGISERIGSSFAPRMAQRAAGTQSKKTSKSGILGVLRAPLAGRMVQRLGRSNPTLMEKWSKYS